MQKFTLFNDLLKGVKGIDVVTAGGDYVASRGAVTGGYRSLKSSASQMFKQWNSFEQSEKEINENLEEVGEDFKKIEEKLSETSDKIEKLHERGSSIMSQMFSKKQGLDDVNQRFGYLESSLGSQQGKK